MIAALLLTTAWAASPSFEVEAVVRWPGTKKFEGVVVGGLSAVHEKDGRLFLLSDDRGHKGPPRFYLARWEVSAPSSGNSRPQVILEKQRPLQGLKEFFRDKIILDPEGLTAVGSQLFISSEADTGKKPRQKNRLLVIEEEGRLTGEIELPSELQAEAIGRQARGTSNNFGPEGLSAPPGGSFLWMALERPLLVKGEAEKFVRFLRFAKKGKDFVFEKFASYSLGAPLEGEGEILRGVSEVLALDENELLVLERSARIGRSGLSHGGTLTRASCGKAECDRKPFLELSRDLGATFPGGDVPNFEGMTFLGGDRRRLLLVSDNNFSTSTETVFLLLKFKEPL